MENKKQFKVRDLRRKDKFVMDDEYLNGYAKHCKPNGTCVYMSLCRHADKDQESWPSIDKIAEEHGISRWSAMRGTAILVKFNIIKKIKERDEKTKRQLNNVYVLLDKSEWAPKPSSRVAVSNTDELQSRVANSNTEIDQAECNPATRENESRVAESEKSRVAVTDCKETHNAKETHEYVAPDATPVLPNFLFEDYLQKMHTDPRRHVQIIADYWVKKGYHLENKEQCESAIKRDARAAAALKAYSDARIAEVMDWLIATADYIWTLETVGKKINENLKEAKVIEKKKKEFYQGMEVRRRRQDGKIFVLKDGEWFDFAGKETEIKTDN